MVSPNSASIVVVGSRGEIVRSVVSACRRNNIAAFGAGSGAETLSLLGQNRAQVLVCGAQLSDMSGARLVDTVKSSWPRTAVVALNGVHDSIADRFGHFPVADAHLDEPFTSEEVLAAISRATMGRLLDLDLAASDSGLTASEQNLTASDPGLTASDPGPTALDPGLTASDPGLTASDPGGEGRDNVQTDQETPPVREPPVTVIEYQDLRIDLLRFEVLLGGQAIPVTRTELEVFLYLLKNRGRPVGPVELERAVRGADLTEKQCRQLAKKHVSRLREKIEPDPSNPRYIWTIWGQGYLADNDRETR